MPFTLAHPAAVWPLRRAPCLQLLPLLMGSVAPDLPDYMPGRIARHLFMTHYVTGSLLLDVPLGLVALLGVVLLRVPLTELAGSRAGPVFRDALERFARTPISWLLAPVSVFVGVWTHLLWDSFTHAEGWAVPYIPLLQSRLTLLGHDWELCHLLQYLSSAAGIAVVILWCRSAVSAAPECNARQPDRTRRQVLAGVLAAGLILGVAESLNPIQGQPIYQVFYVLLTRTVAWLGLLYLLAGTFMCLRQRMLSRA